MVRAHAAAHVTEFADADVTLLYELRKHLKAKAQANGVKLTFLPFFAKAVCAALKEFPVLNSHFTDKGIQTFSDVHLGVAVDTDKGLVVPVIRDADKKSVEQLARELAVLADAARKNALKPEQITGSTFSISSIGPLRVQGFTPMLNTPENAILGIGAIRDTPWAAEGNIAVRKVVTLSLTFDHRALDGAEAARFLSRLVELCEDPELLVLEGV